MFGVLSVFLLTCVYHAAKLTFGLSIDANELSVEHQNQLLFPTIDPNIAEDAKLTTVRFKKKEKNEKRQKEN